jgi:nitroreductase
VNEQDWARVVGRAVRAPSIHNTQPWRFVGHPDRLELRLDPERALPVLDPSRRQQVISCGAALEFAAVALRAAGSSCGIDLAPDVDEPDLLAVVRVTGAHEVTDDDRALEAAIEHRHTVRAAFEPRPVPAEVVDAWQADAGARGVWLDPITRDEEEVATAFLLSRAEEMERNDPAYVEELRRWVRTDPGAEDGVPMTAVPDEDPATRPSNWLVRDFVAGDRPEHAFLPAEDPDAPPPAVERPTVLLMGTMNDDRAAWLEAGRAMGHLLLSATSAGLAASPLTQALDWTATRERLRARLRLVGHPQMLLRVGYPPAAEPGPASGRRPVEDVLTVEAG